MDNTTDILFDGSGFDSLIDATPALYDSPNYLDYGTYFALFSAYSWFWWVTTILVVVAMWIIFNKAKRPGWAAIIPIYSTIVYLDMVGRPWWWLLLMLIPVVNIVIGIIVLNDLSKAFGYSAGYTVGLVFLPWIFMPILAFGSAQYQRGGTPTPPSHPTPTDSQSGGQATSPEHHEEPPTPPTPPVPPTPPTPPAPHEPPPTPPVPPTQM